MSQKRKNFIPRNEGFLCQHCGFTVVPAKGTFRNHCPNCLYSKHVDEIPGDRLGTCQGLMPTVRIEGTDPDMLDLVHLCNACNKEQRNKVAEDDNRELMFSLINQK